RPNAASTIASKKPAAMMSNSQLEAIRLQSQMVAPRKVGTSGPSRLRLRQVVACPSIQAMGFPRTHSIPCAGEGRPAPTGGHRRQWQFDLKLPVQERRFKAAHSGLRQGDCNERLDPQSAGAM